MASAAHQAPPIGTSDASAASAEASVAAGDILEVGDSGAPVRDVQRRLSRMGYPLSADGGYGPYTEGKVKAFQRDYDVAPTGKVGPTTLLALRVAEAQRSDIAIVELFPSVGPGRHLAQGDRGIEVQTLQRMLNLTGQNLTVDGSFGPSTRAGLQRFQRDHGVSQTGELGPTTLRVLDTKVDALAANVAVLLDLPTGYESLEKLAGELSSRDGRFSTHSADGRSALSMALAIGGTEVYGRYTTATDFFTRLGGTGNRMIGFAQFNLDYHAYDTATPGRYVQYLGDILTGRARMPNSGPASDHVRALSDAVTRGAVSSGYQLELFMRSRGFGGSNWQGIDDGWGRNPGLGDALIRFMRGGRSGAGHV